MGVVEIILVVIGVLALGVILHYKDQISIWWFFGSLAVLFIVAAIGTWGWLGGGLVAGGVFVVFLWVLFPTLAFIGVLYLLIRVMDAFTGEDKSKGVTKNGDNERGP